MGDNNMNLKQLVEHYGGCDKFIVETEKRLRQLAQEKPDFIYQPIRNGEHKICYYDRGASNGPKCSACLFGQALQQMGWNDTAEMSVIMPIRQLLYDLAQTSVPMSWSSMQRAQDRGNTWANVIKLLGEAI